jgi:hypothetical protein
MKIKSKMSRGRKVLHGDNTVPQVCRQCAVYAGLLQFYDMLLSQGCTLHAPRKLAAGAVEAEKAEAGHARFLMICNMPGPRRASSTFLSSRTRSIMCPSTSVVTSQKEVVVIFQQSV